LELSSTCFDIHLVNQLICQNKWKITAKFCGLLRKAELYRKGFQVKNRVALKIAHHLNQAPVENQGL